MDHKTILMGTAALVIAAVATPTLAQPAVRAANAAAAAEAGAQIEEVLVTARKKQESLQDVPVAISAATAEELQRVRIDEPNDIARISPSTSLSVAPGGGATNTSVTMRGQRGSDVLLTLSQPVGIYIDGVNVPHPVGTNGSFIDLERIEVLKGPQGTLYGRNTTAGAINVITRNADFEGLHGYLEGEVSNYDGYRLAGAINVPLIKDMLAARITAQHWDRDGYQKSTITGQTVGSDRDDDLIRASLKFTPNERFTAIAKYEYAEFNRNGLPYTILFRTPTAAALTVPEINNVVGASGQAVLAACTNTLQFSNCSGTVQRDDVTTHHAVLDMRYDVSDELTFRSITGYHKFTNYRVFDLDATPWTIGENGAGTGRGALRPFTGIAVPPAGVRLPDGTLAPSTFGPVPVPLQPDQASGQFTQEFNVSGTYGMVSWLVGAFYSDDDGNGSQVTVRTPGTAIRTAPNYSFSASSFEALDVGSKTYAIFSQNDIKLTDQLSLTVGVRYTEEKLAQLNASWAYNQSFEHAALPSLTGPGRVFQCTFGPLAGSLTGDAFGGPRPINYQADRTACAVTQKAKFHGTSYLGSVNYKVTEDTLVYAKISRGFRGGALQQRAPYLDAVNPEIAEDIELGFKGDFLDRRVRLNAAAYRTNYKNQQLSTIAFVPGTSNPAVPGSGTRTTILTNAASSRYQGAEIELRVLPFQGMSIYGNAGVIDAYFRDFPNAPAVIGAVSSVINAKGTQIDLPKYTGNVGARYQREVGPGTLGVQADVNFFTRTPLTALQNEVAVPDSYEKFLRKGRQLVSARLDYAMPEYGVTLALWATNLTNEHWQSPGIGSSANGGLVTGFTREPRMYGINIRKTFGGRE